MGSLTLQGFEKQTVLAQSCPAAYVRTDLAQTSWVFAHHCACLAQMKLDIKQAKIVGKIFGVNAE